MVAPHTSPRGRNELNTEKLETKTAPGERAVLRGAAVERRGARGPAVCAEPRLPFAERARVAAFRYRSTQSDWRCHAHVDHVARRRDAPGFRLRGTHGFQRARQRQGRAVRLAG